eukprot:scaffold1956_cov109-Cylindrotheca_fusiformis.AAC.5
MSTAIAVAMDCLDPYDQYDWWKAKHLLHLVIFGPAEQVIHDKKSTVHSLLGSIDVRPSNTKNGM